MTHGVWLEHALSRHAVSLTCCWYALQSGKQTLILLRHPESVLQFRQYLLVLVHGCPTMPDPPTAQPLCNHAVHAGPLATLCFCSLPALRKAASTILGSDQEQRDVVCRSPLASCQLCPLGCCPDAFFLLFFSVAEHRGLLRGLPVSPLIAKGTVGTKCSLYLVTWFSLPRHMNLSLSRDCKCRRRRACVVCTESADCRGLVAANLWPPRVCRGRRADKMGRQDINGSGPLSKSPRRSRLLQARLRRGRGGGRRGGRSQRGRILGHCPKAGGTDLRHHDALPTFFFQSCHGPLGAACFGLSNVVEGRASGVG